MRVSRVAFLGLGAMGLPMASRLLEARHDLTVWNRTPGREGDLVARGAHGAPTPSDAARGAEVVITMLADVPALEQVLFGDDGVAATIAPTATLVDMSTVGPTAIRAATARLRPVAVVDAPVLGSVPHAETGALSILAGGEPEDVARCAEVLEPLGTVQHVGPLGSGATIKLANNAGVMSAMTCLGEVLAFTDRAGLDPDTVLDALGAGPLGSFVERFRDKVTGRVRSIDFRLALARKDLALALEEARSAGLELTVPMAAMARCDEAIANGRGDQDNTALVAEVRSGPPTG